MAADLNFTPDAADLALLRALLADGSLSAKEAGRRPGFRNLSPGGESDEWRKPG